MRVLIVEDNAFNAFCLTRLLESVYQQQVQIIVVNDSLSALNYLAQNNVALVILDGDLGVSDGVNCNGPALADAIWSNDPQLPIVAWSDSDSMRSAFAEVFKRYNQLLNEYTCWTKVVSQERIRQSLAYLIVHGSREPLSTTKQISNREQLHA